MAIDAFQADVARIALDAAGSHGFALAGGNALVAHVIVQRPTEDVDLFSDEAGAPGAVMVSRGNESMQLDMARDWRRWPPSAAIDHGYSRADLMRLTFTRDPGLRVVDFTHAMRQLDQLGLEEFADYGLDGAAVSELRRRFADWPRSEEDDHEGRVVHAAVADEERRARP